MALIAVTVAVGGCSGVIRPEPEEWNVATADDKGATAMSFNLLVGGQPTPDTLDVIAAASADLLCLQEMTAEFAAAFRQRFPTDYPHLIFHPHPTVEGVGIASRFALSDERLLFLGTAYLPALAASVNIDGRPVRVACAHFVPHFAGFEPAGGLRERYYINRDIRAIQARQLIDHLDGSGLPAIILGDLNEWPGQTARKALGEAGFADACSVPSSRCGPTWPGEVLSGPALVRIDHILGRGIEFRQTAVLEAAGSDHYPLVTRFRPLRER